MIWISVQNRHSRILLRDLPRSRMWKMHREPEVLEAEWLDCLQGLPRRNLRQFILWKMASSRMLVLQVRKWMQVWVKSARMHTARLMNSLAKGLKRMVTKVQWLFLKNFVFKDMEPPKPSSILWKSSNILKPIRCVKFTKAVVRHANIRDQKSIDRIYLPRWTSSA